MLRIIDLFLILSVSCQRTWTWPSAPRQPRLSIAQDWSTYNDFEPEGAGTYSFGYDIEDSETENVQFRNEERHQNGTVVGSYGYVKPDGNIFVVRYIADERGYRATVEDSSSKFRTDVYRQQKVHEERTRPIDRITRGPSYNRSPRVQSDRGDMLWKLQNFL